MSHRVFISSTSLDLKRYRRAAIEACKTLGFEPVAMEDFEAMGVGATEGSKRKLKEADLFVGIVAHRYGYIEQGYDRSVTEAEFDYARERGLECLCFIVEPAATWPKTHIERKNTDKLAAFKAKIDQSVIRALFTDIHDFRAKLINALVNWQEWRSVRSGELEAILALSPDDVPDRPERLIGRAALLAEIDGLLDKGKRVLLQGFGGMGKTALAAWVVAERITAGKGPVLWLRAGTEDRDGLMLALSRPFKAQAALTKETSPANQARIVRTLLSTNQVRLVVLDDAWNARALTQLLSVNALPAGLPILVTSRSRFVGLTRLDVGRLPRPAALELLASLGDPEWAHDPAADTLCDKLGDHTYAVRVAGLTLALDGLAPTELLTRIAAAPWKLAAPEGTEEEGRSGVEDLLKTSLYGLDAEARAAFWALGAFFSTSITPEMLGLYMELDATAAEDALNRLQRRGLAERVGDSAEREMEYRMHDLAYGYARSQAKPADQQRALAACLRYLEHYREPNRANFPALRSELDNFMGAIAWAMSAERYAEIQQFADGLYRSFDSDTTDGFLHLQGYASLATTLLAHAATASEALKQPARRAAYLGSLGSAYRDIGQVKTGLKHYSAALKLYRDLGDRVGEGVTLTRIGVTHRLSGEAKQAIEHFQQALAIAREHGNVQAEGINLASLGIAYRQAGQHESALAHLNAALTIARARGDKRGEAINLGNMGDIDRDLERPAQAIAHYENALAIAREMGDKRGEGINLGRLGDAYRVLREYERAETLIQQALTIARETDDKRSETINLGRLGDVYRDQQRTDEAVAEHQRGLDVARHLDDKHGEAYALHDLGLDALAAGQNEQAAAYLERARALFVVLGLAHRADEAARRLAALQAPPAL